MFFAARHFVRGPGWKLVAAISLATLCSLPALGTPASVSLATTAPCSVVFGSYQTDAPWSWARITDLDTRINRHSAIVHWYAEWGDSPGSADFANELPLLNATVQYSSAGVTGSTPMITWEPWGPPYSASVANYPLRDLAAGRFDSYVDSWAAGLKKWGRPLYLRFAHEMEGDWYPWGAGVNGNTAADYIAAYRHVHDRFTALGVTNVLWVWSPSEDDGSGMRPPISNFYPGSSYVDWLGFDPYNWGTTESWSAWRTFDQIASLTYSELMTIGPGKPIMLAEWASAEQGGNKGQWLQDAGASLSKYPNIKAAVWFGEAGTQFAFDSSAGSLSGANAAFGGCASPSPSPSPTVAPPPSPTPTPSPSPAPTPPPAAVDNAGHLYTVDAWGGIHPVGPAPPLAPSGYWRGWNIVRGIAVLPDGSGGYTVDGWGGIHPFGQAPSMPISGYWRGWDIVRGIALLPDGSGGYTVDGWGGIHPFGKAPSMPISAYYAGSDIVRGIALLPDGSGGYTVDGFGGLHPFGKAPPLPVSGYWAGWDIVRGLALLPDGSGGYTLDGWGGLHPFGKAPNMTPGAYWPGWDIARGVVTWNKAPGAPGGWVADGWGGIHPFGSAADLVPSGYWSGWDIVNGAAGAGSGSGSRRRL